MVVLVAGNDPVGKAWEQVCRLLLADSLALWPHDGLCPERSVLQSAGEFWVTSSLPSRIAVRFGSAILRTPPKAGPEMWRWVLRITIPGARVKVLSRAARLGDCIAQSQKPDLGGPQAFLLTWLNGLFHDLKKVGDMQVARRASSWLSGSKEPVLVPFRDFATASFVAAWASASPGSVARVRWRALFQAIPDTMAIANGAASEFAAAAADLEQTAAMVDSADMPSLFRSACRLYQMVSDPECPANWLAAVTRATEQWSSGETTQVKMGADNETGV